MDVLFKNMCNNKSSTLNFPQRNRQRHQNRNKVIITFFLTFFIFDDKLYIIESLTGKNGSRKDNKESSNARHGRPTAVMRPIIQLSRDSRARLRPSTAGEISYDGYFMNREEDDTEELALNLSTILLSKYQNDADFLSALAKNLINEEYRWKEEANRCLSDVSATILITIYNCLTRGIINWLMF